MTTPPASSPTRRLPLTNRPGPFAGPAMQLGHQRATPLSQRSGAGGRDRFRACGLCRVKAQSSSFAAQVSRSERPLTSRFVIPCCLLLSPRFRRATAPARPTQALSGPTG